MTLTMTIIAAVVVCLTVKVTFAVEEGCPNSLQCPCGIKGGNVTVCVPAADADICARLSKCETCEDGFSFCTTCPEGLEGPFCTQEFSYAKSRQKRQLEKMYTVHRGHPRPAGGSLQYRRHLAAQTDIDDMLFCDNPGPILNGRVRYFHPSARRSPSSSLDYDPDELPVNSRLRYDCDEGFRLQGSHTSRCESTGLWSAAPPSCDADCGRSFMYTNGKIIGGYKTKSGDWPWVVSISVLANDGSRFICGGALLNSHTIITAAHCLIGKNLIIRFGKHHFRIEDDDNQVLVRRSSRVIIHPEYSNSTMDSDIGLVIFQSRIRYSIRVQPICLPTPQSTARNIKAGRIGYVSGWGDTEKELPSDELKLAQLPVVTREACTESYREHNVDLTITNNMFCAGYPDARQTVCSGDSGSPFVFYDKETERFTLEGLVSFGMRGQCGVAGRYPIFTRVFKFLPWIYRHLQ